MKPLIVIIAICTLGYAADHWQDIKERHSLVAPADPHGLIIYESKTYPDCVRLESELTKAGIHHERRDLEDDTSYRELTEKLARVGKSGGKISIPVAEIDGVLYQGASIEEIQHRLHGAPGIR